MLTCADILGQQGRIAARLPHYEFREEQLTMADAVARAIQQRRHLVVEAGTGVGKSFAYLVPAILAATEGAEAGDAAAEPRPPSRPPAGLDPAPPRRVVIATHTISLQEQLIDKDLPLLRSVVPREFSAVLFKGRHNYLSLRRLAAATERASGLFYERQEHAALKRLNQWARVTSDGSLFDLGYTPLSSVWDEAASDSGNCLGRNCPNYKRCFYFQARRRAANAQVVVVNHALFFSDLALRRVGASLLPDYDVVIFDEAHNLESVASQHLGLSVTSGQVEYVLNRLFNDRTNKGLLVHFGLREAERQVDEARLAAADFFDDVAAWCQTHAASNGRVTAPECVPNELSPALSTLAATVKHAAAGMTDEVKRQDLVAAFERLQAISGELEQWRMQRLAGAVYWVDTSLTRRGRPRTGLSAAPIDIAPILREELLAKVPTVIMTSATLAVGRDRSFAHFKSRLGLAECELLQLGSPFDYRSQAELILPQGMPDPAADPPGFERQVMAMIRRYVARSSGRAFVLFTSYQLLRRAATELADWCSREGLTLLSQAEGLPRSKMIEAFKANPRSVLFGTDSFWQGVDVPGEALTNVIITKLPFAVPSEPLMEARLETIRERGGNPFTDYQLPEAVLKLKQGFGRLIRSRRDRGIVVILDPRIESKPYGRVFLDSLPPCRVTREPVAADAPV